MGRFTRVADGVRMDLEGFEVELLEDLRSAIRDALADPDADDPALRRLFPAAIRGDEIEDAAVRLQFHDALLEARLAGLDALAELLTRSQRRRGDVRRTVLVDDEPALVLGVLNDLRLALAARLGMDSSPRPALDDDDPRRPGLAVIDHLAWLQEQLVRLLDPAATAHQDDPVFLARIEQEPSP